MTRRFAKYCVGPFLCVFLCIEYLNFSGFCYSQRRQLSDAELISAAVTENLRRHGPGSDRRKMYGSLDEFYRENSNCCLLNRWNIDPCGDSIFFRLLGAYQVVVDVVYRINDGTGVEQFYKSTTVMNR